MEEREKVTGGPMYQIQSREIHSKNDGHRQDWTGWEKIEGDRQIDKQTKRKTGRQTNRQPDRQRRYAVKGVERRI